MPTNKMTTFTVEGTYPFPVDMLRYDGCYPASTHDAVQLGDSCRGPSRTSDPKRKRQVTLSTTLFNKPTTARWESFGWRVIS